MNDSTDSKRSRWSVGLVVAAVIAVVFFGLFALRIVQLPSWLSATNSEPPQLLRDAIRTGSSDFNRLAAGIMVGPLRLNTITRDAHNDRVLEIRSSIKNGTDEVINGLELAAVLNEGGKEIRRVVITPINRGSTGRPAGELQTALRPGDSVDALFIIDGLDRQYSENDVKIEVTGMGVE
jgi:hypothetical protein